ncbi:MAG: flagellar M-ring protein FliF [Sphingomonas sp.]|nr:flagellar M-ring protein FliF [Sphingomonas sp.]
MSDQPDPRPAPQRRQLFILGGVFAGVVLLLTAAYLVFLQPSYVVLAENLRPAEAAALVAELDKRGTPYRLDHAGTTILVPAGDADATRVAIAGADAVQTGQVGLELFNKSDMGLTNFAQKINYQRALQGELVRTLHQMSGVRQARVHLAIPERALFRGDRAVPKAAVSITLRPGHALTPDRVAGVQRLVAASVPDLPEEQVVVLDGDGNVVSPRPATPTDPAAETTSLTPESEERRAIQLYYQARARRALDARLPGVALTVRALVQPQTPGTPVDWTPAGEGAARNYALRLIVLATAPLNAEDQAVAREAVQTALALDPARGDSVQFEQDAALTNAPPLMPTPGLRRPAAPSPAPAPVAPEAKADGVSLAPGGWWWSLLLLVPAALLLWWQRRGPSLSDAEHIGFAERLKRQLNLTEAKDAAG